MMFNEDMVEQAVLSSFKAMGYVYADPALIGPDAPQKERTANGEVLLLGRLREAVARLNPDIPARGSRGGDQAGYRI